VKDGQLAQNLLTARPFLAQHDPDLFRAVTATIRAAIPPLFGRPAPETAEQEQRRLEDVETVKRAVMGGGP